MPKSPQIEDGMTMVANELVEALCKINLSAYESRVVWCIFRKTYGYHKKTDRISYSQFELSTGLKRWHVNRALLHLIDRQIIQKNGEGYDLEYGIQKDYDLWDSLPKEVTNIVTETGNESLPNQVTIIDEKSLPIQEESLPIQVASLPKEVTKSLPKEVNTKERNILTKNTTKEKSIISFDDYKEQMRERYPDLNFDNEVQKWHEYWYEGRKKCTNPKLALHNWLDRARQWKENGGNGSGKHQGYNLQEQGNDSQPSAVTARTRGYSAAELQASLDGNNI